MTLRALLYAFGRALGDWNAVSKGPDATLRRIGRRAAGKATGRLFRRLFP